MAKISFFLLFGLLQLTGAARQNLGVLLDTDNEESQKAALLQRAGQQDMEGQELGAHEQGTALGESLVGKGGTRTVARTVTRILWNRVERPPEVIEVPGAPIPAPDIWPVEAEAIEDINRYTDAAQNNFNLANSVDSNVQAAQNLNADNLRALQQNSNQIGNLQNALDVNANTAQAVSDNIANIQSATANNVGDISQLASRTAARQRTADAVEAITSMNADNLASNVAAANANANVISNRAAHLNDISNVVSANANQISANANTINSISNTAAQNAANLQAVGNNAAANTATINAVTAAADANAQTIAALGPRVTMLLGSAASNTAELSSLSAQVDVLNQVAGPSMALSSALGVPLSTISTLSLAGAFVGPAMGAMALVYVTWPPPKNDPWWSMESRVQQMIEDKFGEERRDRLGKRLKRLIRAFSRCSSAWVSAAMEGSGDDGQVASALQLAMHHASRGELPQKWHSEPESLLEKPKTRFGMKRDWSHDKDVREVLTSTPIEVAAPPCMGDLEGHMSLERDEWMERDGDSLSGLFMPFANLHTQIQGLLRDFPPATDRHMKWYLTVRDTAGEYAVYMLDAIFSGWKAQMCRSVRLRYTVKNAFWWKYFLTVLEPQWQPNAGEECWEKCGGRSGWCNFCGGHKVGACCKKGAAQTNPPQDPSECLDFDAPVSTGIMGGPYHTCVHVECGQQNSEYRGVTDVAKIYLNSSDWKTCQDYCQTVPESKYFAVMSARSRRAFKCKCQKGEGERVYRRGVISGPRNCPRDKKLEEEPVQTEEMKKSTPNVPMTERRPCAKSPAVRNMESLNEDHHDWMGECYRNASKMVVQQYNPFYKRFAQFVDVLARKAGCYTDGWYLTKQKEEDWDGVAEEMDFSHFSECDWKREGRRTNEVKYYEDQEKRRGLTGLSKLDTQEQSRMKMKYSLPKWLQKRRTLMDCLIEKYPAFAPKHKEGEGEKQAMKQIEGAALR